jgi:glyoxylase-like metal-dependent hydrolase (beta-lactamase superfamily II)
MHNRIFIGMLCLVVVLAAAWMSRSGTRDKKSAWEEVAPGILRSTALPAGHALVDGDAALLVDAPNDFVDLKGIRKIDGVLLTHYHRDVCRGVDGLLKKGIKVRALKGSEEWLSRKGVANYWKESLPLRNSRTAYLVVPEGFDGIDYSLEGGQRISWRGWEIEVITTPGHARTHVAFAARRGKDGPVAVFCGGALASQGKMWSPYTTDWDHWTDLGLRPAAESLRTLAKLKPAALYPAYGPPISANTVDVLTRTAEVVDEVGFLKSFERFSKQRLKNPPAYAFLAKEQAGSAGEKPWSKISEHLYLT